MEKKLIKNLSIVDVSKVLARGRRKYQGRVIHPHGIKRTPRVGVLHSSGCVQTLLKKRSVRRRALTDAINYARGKKWQVFVFGVGVLAED